jgi:hypothetical protein
MNQMIEKDTYVDADEKTTKALTFDLLNNIHDKVSELASCYHKHLGTCEDRFKKIEDRKRHDTTVSAVTGIGGGFLAMMSYYIKQWLS